MGGLREVLGGQQGGRWWGVSAGVVGCFCGGGVQLCWRGCSGGEVSEGGPFGAYNADALQARSVFGVNHEVEVGEGEFVADFGQSACCPAEVTAEGFKVPRGQRNAEVFGKLFRGQSGVHEEAAVVYFFNGLFVFFKLVANVADNFSENVLQGDDADEASIFVHDDGHVDALFLHIAQQVSDGLKPGDIDGGANHFLEDDVLWGTHKRQQVPDVEDAEDAFFVVAEDRHTRVVLRGEGSEDFGRRGMQVNGDDVCSWHHDVSAAFVGQLEDGVNKLRSDFVHFVFGGLGGQEFFQVLKGERGGFKAGAKAHRLEECIEGACNHEDERGEEEACCADEAGEGLGPGFGFGHGCCAQAGFNGCCEEGCSQGSGGAQNPIHIFEKPGGGWVVRSKEGFQV